MAAALLIVSFAANQRAIDLDLVKREVDELAQRSNAGPEAVHGNTYTEASKSVQRQQHIGSIPQKDVFGHFDLQTAARQPGRLQGALYGCRELGGFKVKWRDVDRQRSSRQAIAPLPCRLP